MHVTSAHAAMLIGDQAGMQGFLRDKNVATKDESIELGETNTETTAIAVERLQMVSSLISGLPFVTQNGFNLFINIKNTPEGINAAKSIMANLGHSAMMTPSAVTTPKIDDRPPVQFTPTEGGMAIGLIGGIGLGMVVEALRMSANAAGHPVLGQLAIGMGLAGTAIGGGMGATGTYPTKIKILDFLEITLEKIKKSIDD